MITAGYPPVSGSSDDDFEDPFLEEIDRQELESTQNAKLNKWMDGMKIFWDQALSQKLSPYFTEIEFRETIARRDRVEREESLALNLIEQDFLKPVSHKFWGEKVLVEINGYGTERRLYENSVGINKMNIY